MTEERSRPAGVWHWVRTIISAVPGGIAGGGEKEGRPGRSAEQLVVTCLVVGVILVIAVILVSALATSRPG